jgi:hypothetical protein
LLEEAQDRLRIETAGQPDQHFKLLVTELDRPNAVRTDKAWQIEVAFTLATGRPKAALSADSAGWPRSVDQRASSFDGDFTGVQFANGGWTVHEEKLLNGKAVDWGKIGKELSLFSCGGSRSAWVSAFRTSWPRRRRVLSPMRSATTGRTNSATSSSWPSTPASRLATAPRNWRSSWCT